VSATEYFLAQDTPAPRRADQGWMVMFTDLVCLMLTFFVLLYSMASPEPRLWKEIAQDDTPGTKTATWQPPRLEVSEFAVRESEAALELTYLGALLRRQINGAGGLRDVAVRTHRDSIVITLPSTVLFTAGSATLSDGGRQALVVVAAAVANVKNAVEVLGHTDPESTAGSGFASNWDLSLARALAVAEAVKAAGYARPVTVQGFADGRFAEIPSDYTQARRYALARRVDIVLRPESFSTGAAR
jgi:chemotaxis protein MotB